MFELRRVLVATDASEHALAALVTGQASARRSSASLDVVSVFETFLLPLGFETAEYHDTLSREYEAKLRAQLAEVGIDEDKLHLRRGLPAPLITQVAEELESDLVVVGAHPRPAVARFLVGSTAERVIRLAHVPVLVAIEARPEPFRRILVALDLSGQSQRVFRIAVALAAADGAELRALYVQDRLTPMLLEAALFDEKETRHHARNLLQKTMAQMSIPSELMVSREIREGHAGHEILHAAKEWDADLIVTGTHGFGFFNRLLLGSTSVHVLRHGSRATLVVPRAAEGAGAEPGAR